MVANQSLLRRIVDVVLPTNANNDYRGGRVAFIGFCVLVAERTFSAMVHFLTPDGGKNSIASIIVFKGDPDPNPIAYMFASISGMHETLFVLLCGLVLWRYRNLIPLMITLMLIRMVFGLVVSTLHPLTPEYFEHTPPAMLIRVPKYLVISGLLFFAVRQSLRAVDSPTRSDRQRSSSILDAVFPRDAGNNYTGSAIAFYGYCLLLAVMLFRSTVHFLKDDSGVNSIASIMVFEGAPDPNNLIYLFSSLGGAEQMIFVILYGVVLWRYRSLIPLMFAFFIMESCLGFVVTTLHPLDPIYFERVPPGKLMMLPKLALGITLLFLSVRNTKPRGALPSRT